MTLEELRAFIEGAPWRAVKGIPEGPLNKPPEAHEYLIKEWKEIDSAQFERFAHTIRRLGHRGRYRAPYSGKMMTNRYLVVDEHVFWFIYPRQVCRTLVAERQYEPLGEQLALEDDSSLSAETRAEPSQNGDSPATSGRDRLTDTTPEEKR